MKYLNLASKNRNPTRLRFWRGAYENILPPFIQAFPSSIVSTLMEGIEGNGGGIVNAGVSRSYSCKLDASPSSPSPAARGSTVFRYIRRSSQRLS
jgi:hypothetical protein